MDPYKETHKQNIWNACEVSEKYWVKIRYNQMNVDKVVSILFYFVVLTDLNPYSRHTQQDAYDKSQIRQAALGTLLQRQLEFKVCYKSWQRNHYSGLAM
jgi:hypothetical protein